MTKTNEGLAWFAEQSVGVVPYLYGTFGQILTERLLAEKARDYPARYSEKRVKYARDHFIGKRTTDCYGLPKRYKWTAGEAEFPSQNEPPVYNAKQDISANDAYNRAKVKGTINTMPDVPGILVRYPGHVGVYVGRDAAGVQWVVEARGFDYGTVRTKLKERNWTHWFQDPDIVYKTPEPAPGGDILIKVQELKKGSKGPEVFIAQCYLKEKKFKDQNGKDLICDSSFGAKTQYAVNNWLASIGLPRTGTISEKAWNIMING